MSRGIPINKHLVKDGIIDMEKILYRKYLNLRILHFFFLERNSILNPGSITDPNKKDHS
jgi:hypothetical protein